MALVDDDEWVQLVYYLEQCGGICVLDRRIWRSEHLPERREVAVLLERLQSLLLVAPEGVEREDHDAQLLGHARGVEVLPVE